MIETPPFQLNTTSWGFHDDGGAGLVRIVLCLGGDQLAIEHGLLKRCTEREVRGEFKSEGLALIVDDHCELIRATMQS